MDPVTAVILIAVVVYFSVFITWTVTRVVQQAPITAQLEARANAVLEQVVVTPNLLCINDNCPITVYYKTRDLAEGQRVIVNIGDHQQSSIESEGEFIFLPTNNIFEGLESEVILVSIEDARNQFISNTVYFIRSGVVRAQFRALSQNAQSPPISDTSPKTTTLKLGGSIDVRSDKSSGVFRLCKGSRLLGVMFLGLDGFNALNLVEGEGVVRDDEFSGVMAALPVRFTLVGGQGETISALLNPNEGRVYGNGILFENDMELQAIVNLPESYAEWPDQFRAQLKVDLLIQCA